MENKKRIKKDKFNTLLKIAEVQKNPELVEFIEHELELLAKKNSAEKKPTERQKENEDFKADILATMEEGKLYTIAELMKIVPSCVKHDLSNQRISALLKQLMESGSVEREEIKRKAHFKRA